METARACHSMILGLVLVLALHGESSARSPSMTADMPPEVESWRETILEKEACQSVPLLRDGHRQGARPAHQASLQPGSELPGSAGCGGRHGPA
jgi:hypothetical protein